MTFILIIFFIYHLFLILLFIYYLLFIIYLIIYYYLLTIYYLFVIYDIYFHLFYYLSFIIILRGRVGTLVFSKHVGRSAGRGGKHTKQRHTVNTSPETAGKREITENKRKTSQGKDIVSDKRRERP